MWWCFLKGMWKAVRGRLGFTKIVFKVTSCLTIRNTSIYNICMIVYVCICVYMYIYVYVCK